MESQPQNPEFRNNPETFTHAMSIPNDQLNIIIYYDTKSTNQRTLGPEGLT